jgi:Transposase IS200 like/Helix-turn-helix domain
MIFPSKSTFDILKYINTIKPISSKEIRTNFSDVKTMLWEEIFWSRSYFRATIGQVTLDIWKNMLRVRTNMELVKKIQIYLTEEQVNILWELSDKCRVVYNFVLADRNDA